MISWMGITTTEGTLLKTRGVGRLGSTPLICKHLGCTGCTPAAYFRFLFLFFQTLTTILKSTALVKVVVFAIVGHKMLFLLL